MLLNMTSQASHVYCVFLIYGEGDGYTTFALKGVFSTLEKAVEFAKIYVEKDIRRDPGGYAQLANEINATLTTNGYIEMSRADFEDQCGNYGYGAKSALLIETCALDAW